MEVRERSGLGVFVAEPGGVKSTLLGALGYLAARRCVQVTLLDPSGPLARLCSMPELRPFSRVLNLTGSEQGTLAPYALIPTPLRQHYPAGPSGDQEHGIAVSNARAERRMLVQDICSMLVPPQVAREASTATALRHAVRTVAAEETSTLDDIVTCSEARGRRHHTGRDCDQQDRQCRARDCPRQRPAHVLDLRVSARWIRDAWTRVARSRAASIGRTPHPRASRLGRTDGSQQA